MKRTGGGWVRVGVGIGFDIDPDPDPDGWSILSLFSEQGPDPGFTHSPTYRHFL